MIFIAGPTHSCTESVAVEFAHLESEVQRVRRLQAAAVCNTTGCHSKRGKMYEINNFSAVFCFKQSQLVCAIRIGWKC